jgi:hypothetical protein
MLYSCGLGGAFRVGNSLGGMPVTAGGIVTYIHIQSGSHMVFSRAGAPFPAGGLKRLLRQTSKPSMIASRAFKYTRKCGKNTRYGQKNVLVSTGPTPGSPRRQTRLGAAGGGERFSGTITIVLIIVLWSQHEE